MKKIKQILSRFFPRFLKKPYHAADSYWGHFRYGRPSTKMTVIGVTGTDGKTTTSLLTYAILKAAGQNVACITSISAKIGDKDYDTGFHVTTPDPQDLQRFLKQAVDQGCKVAVVETTSHALAQGRVAAIDYDYGILTNITHEHLDYHKTFEQYFLSKLSLFKKAGFAVVNSDLPVFDKVSAYLKAHSIQFVTYGIEKRGAFWADQISLNHGIDATIHGPDNLSVKVHSELEGGYNVQNMLAAVACTRQLGVSEEAILKGTASLKTLSGRMEKQDLKLPYAVYIDFAHTPNALETVLSDLKKQTQGRLISVFGCAGLRDYKKRPLMGAIAAKYADLSVFTAEDPRTEDLDGIIEVMAKGAKAAGASEQVVGRGSFDLTKTPTFFRQPDRKQAIRFAMKQLASPGDIVVITGKGHEKSMCFGTTEYPWSDQAAVKEIANEQAK